ncbi:hypothetical protein [Thalassolituus oleivorans]|uniref:hypothetical protein n=1 Tax=Thalassolituus oleivorans TaxID=187493 RepID=UPI003C6FD85C
MNTSSENKNSTNSYTPVTVLDSGDLASVTTGNVHTCVLKTDGTVSCWGNNNWGQLGNSIFQLSQPFTIDPITIP